MSKYLTGKLATITILILLLMIPIMMITSIIKERSYYQQTVISEVAKSSSTAQTLAGPILVIPYEVDIIEEDSETKKIRTVTYKQAQYFLPQSLYVNGGAKVTPRKLGIYQAQVYLSELNIKGNFGTIDISDLSEKKNVRVQEPYIVVSLSDTRGIMRASPFKLDGKTLNFKEGTSNDHFTKGMHVPASLEAIIQSEAKNDFSFDLDIQGTQSLAIAPLGRESEFNLESDWPHPSFIGNILPKTHTISEKGFTSQWQSTWFANNVNDLFGDNKAPTIGSNEYESNSELPTFSVSLIETIDQYQLNERAVKYAILFIGLAFIGFVVFEFVGHLRMHPIQYGLVGFALVIFYLVLLALSEQIGFNTAYAAAALASSILIGLYLSSVLKGFVKGFGFSGALLGLYGLLFLILQSEDLALLLGTTLLFVVLASIMLVTRKIDWYQVGSSSSEKTAKKEGRQKSSSNTVLPQVFPVVKNVQENIADEMRESQQKDEGENKN